ncbi:MAG: fibronectin type III domain-containing protein, partial [bacterium]|nr:fibronectin type III domain-containing protein [bacterium]
DSAAKVSSGSATLSDTNWLAGGTQITATGTATYEGTTNVYPPSAATIYAQLHVNAGSVPAGDTDDVATAYTGADTYVDEIEYTGGTFSIPAFTVPSSTDTDYDFDIQIEGVPTSGTDTTSAGSIDMQSRIDADAPTGVTLGFGTITASSIDVTVSGTTDGGSGLHSTPYYFDRNTGTANSGYQASTTWSDPALSVNTQYTYKVKAKDVLANESSFTGTQSKYTLANVPGAPTVNSPTATTLTVIIDVNANPAATMFAIQEVGSGNYVQANGALGAVEWQTYTTWGGAAGVTVTGLSTNTSYTFKVMARNGDFVETALSSGTSAYTAVGAPTNFQATTITATSIALSVATFVNDSVGSAGYRFQITSPAEAVADSGWQSGTAIKTFSSLSPNVQHTFSVTYRNGGAVETGSATLQAYTYANVPSAPTVGTPTTSTAIVMVNTNSNPNNTTFAIQETGSGNYVQANGTLGVAAWQTYTNWGGAAGVTVTGLTAGASYTFQVKARNGDVTETAFSSTASLYTLASAPGIPTVNGAAVTTLNVTINTNANGNNVVYAIQETGSGNYVQVDGSLSGSAVWQANATWGVVTVTGLSVNTQYTFKVKARNNDNIETAFSSTAAAYTLANVPSTPTVDTVTSTTFIVVINRNSNPSATTYAIQVTPSGGSAQWVQTNGTLGASAILQAYTTWGGATGVTVTGLTGGTSYAVSVKARNGDGTDTAVSSSATQLTLTSSSGEARFDQAAPAAPTNFSVVQQDGKALLTWTDPSDADLAKIIILRGEGNTPVSGNVYQTVEKGAQQFLDTQANTEGVKYTYRVKVEDRAGNFSLTEERFVTIKKEDPLAELVPRPQKEPVKKSSENPVVPFVSFRKPLVPVIVRQAFSSRSQPAVNPSNTSSSVFRQNAVVYNNEPRISDDAEPTIDPKTDMESLGQELLNLMNRLFAENSAWRDTYTRAYFFGGYSIKEITQAVRFGGKTVHPTIPASLWRNSEDYKAYIDRE